MVMVKEASSSLLSVLLVGRELLHSMSDWWVEEAWGSITTLPPLTSITLHYITFPYHPTSSHKHYHTCTVDYITTLHCISLPPDLISNITITLHCIALHSIKKIKMTHRLSKVYTTRSLNWDTQKIASSSIRVRRC